MKRLRALFDDGRHDDAWRRLYDLAQQTDDYGRFSSLLRWRRRLAANAPQSAPPRTVRVALLGSATTELLEEPLMLAIEATGLGCEIYQAPFNTFAHEMLVSDSGTVAFDPDVAVVVMTPSAIPDWPTLDDDDARVRKIVEDCAEHFAGMCRALHDNAGCDIVFGNFHRLPTRPLGTAGAKMAAEPSNFIRALNVELAQRLPGYVHINDVEALASQYGVLEWVDARYWHHAKQPVSFQCLVPFVRNTGQLIGALYGRAAKCVVVDLGEGDPLGEAFKALQEYLLQLKQRGLLLAVCSKNEEENALAPFRSRPEMVLKETDFAAFVANWTPKSQNLQTIAQRLNLGLDSLVLIDDNPAEREEVRQGAPQVRVVELSDDPADYPRQIDRTGWFDVVALSGEDHKRASLYRDNLDREEFRASTGDYEGYLVSLEQRAVVGPFEDPLLPRITQLTNKTNQFNLTTRRMSASEIEEIKGSADHLTAYVRLADRFGDNGLISVFIGRCENRTLWIENWLMSCRVFGRGVEKMLCNYVVDRARELGIERIRGFYLPTAKNGLVRDHYSSMGFSALEAAGEDGEHWGLENESWTRRRSWTGCWRYSAKRWTTRKSS